jgi:hypothetical protein
MSHNEAQPATEHVRVCVRLRPLSSDEMANGDSERVYFDTGNCASISIILPDLHAMRFRCSPFCRYTAVG